MKTINTTARPGSWPGYELQERSCYWPTRATVKRRERRNERHQLNADLKALNRDALVSEAAVRQPLRSSLQRPFRDSVALVEDLPVPTVFHSVLVIRKVASRRRPTTETLHVAV